MPFTSALGGSSSLLGGTAPSLGAAAISIWPSWDQTPYLRVTVNGTALTNVLEAVIVYGLDMVVSSAQVECDADPGGFPKNAVVEIFAGTGINNVLRFRGLYKRTRGNMWPHTFTLICRGRMSLAAEYRQSRGAGRPSFINERLPITGISLSELLAGAVATDQNIVLATLHQVPGLNVDPADIGGTGHIFGTLAYRDAQWPPYRSALQQCQLFNEVCLGYRLMENMGGRIMRPQVFGYPTNVSDVTFTEGVDVWEATGERSIEDLINAEYVEGYALGGKPGLLNAFLQESNSFQPSTEMHVEQFSHALIEDAAYAAQVASWKLTERNREGVDIQLVTFKDDLLFCGRTIAVNIPHSAVTEPVWMQHVEIRVRNEPALFQQAVGGVGGGVAAGGHGVGTYRPPDIY